MKADKIKPLEVATPRGSLYLLNHKLESIISSDITRLVSRGNDFFLMDKSCPFVNDFILYMNIFTDCNFSEYNTVSDNSTFFYDTSTSDYGIFNSAFDLAAVGNYGIPNFGCIEILSRAGVIGTCVDWPVLMEQFLSRFVVKKIHICRIITWKVCNACKESLVGNTTDIQSFAFVIQDICQSVHGGKFFGFFNQTDEEFCLHHTGIHVDILVFLITMVRFDGINTFLTVQIQNITGQISFFGIINRMIKEGDICGG